MSGEVVSIGVLSGVAGLFSSFYEHFKPSRSPYLLGGILCIVSLALTSEKEFHIGTYLLIFVPVGGTFALLSVLCFFFDPRKAVKDTEISAAADEIDIKEINDQFIFSRTLCLSAGIILITYLFYNTKNIDTYHGIFFAIAYVLCIIHIVIFITYVTFRNMQEEKVINLSLFQITFFTIGALSGLVVLGGRVNDTTDFSDAVFLSCQTTVTYDSGGSTLDWKNTLSACRPENVVKQLAREKNNISNDIKDVQNVTAHQTIKIVSNRKITYWYFLIFVVVFETFWLKRLHSIAQFKVNFIISG